MDINQKKKKDWGARRVVIKSIKELFDKAKEKGPKRCVVAAGEDEVVIKALYEAMKNNIAKGILFGKRNKIKEICRKENIDLNSFEVVDCGEEKSIEEAVKFVREEGDFLLKGKTSTTKFLRGVLSKKYGLRTHRTLSHIAIIEPKEYGKLLFVTDGGMNITPRLAVKIDIINNAIDIAHSLGIEKPKIALLAAVETVNPKMKETMDWATITQMAERGQIKGALIDGPLALDLAVSRDAAKLKNVGGEVVGDADILVVPDIACGNIFAKGLIYLGGAKACGIIAGASRPVVMLSRADTPEIKLYSIALGALVSARQK